MQGGEGTQLCPIKNVGINVTGPGCRNPPCHMKNPVGQQFNTRKRNKQKQAYLSSTPSPSLSCCIQACPSWRPVENLENKNKHLFSRVMKGWLVLVVDVEVRAVKKGVQ